MNDVEQVDREELSVSRRELMAGTSVVAGAAVLGAVPSRALAQQDPDNEISGTVTDAAGAVDGATVVAVPHDESLDPLVTTTDANGDYIFNESALYEGDELYHVIARDGTEADPRRGQENYPFILANGGVAIPDSVVSRPDDNNTFNNQSTRPFGVRISVSQEWPQIQGEFSNNIDGAVSRAYIYDVSDGSLMGDVGVSGNAGEVFTIDLDTSLSAGETYNFVANAEGSSYFPGYYDSPSFPYTSTDGNLEIVNGADDQTATASNAINIRQVGNINL